MDKKTRNDDFHIHLEKLPLMTVQKKVPTSSSPMSLALLDSMLNPVDCLARSLPELLLGDFPLF
jgi:hypothetical protein